MSYLITGTPGTGKTTLARELSKKTGLKLIEVTKLVKKEKLYLRKEGKEFVVNLRSLEKALRKILLREECIIESHLLCELKLGTEIIVLRCNPSVLKTRLKKRSYSIKKIEENTLAEALDYCLIKAEENYSKVSQVDNSDAKALEKLLKKKFTKPRWLNEEMIKKLVNPKRF